MLKREIQQNPLRPSACAIISCAIEDLRSQQDAASSFQANLIARKHSFMLHFTKYLKECNKLHFSYALLSSICNHQIRRPLSNNQLFYTKHIFLNIFHICDCISNILNSSKMQNIQMLTQMLTSKFMSTVEGFYY